MQRKHAVVAAFAGAAAVGLAAQVSAGPELISFPDSYSKGVHSLTVDKPSKQVHEFYASQAAIDAVFKQTAPAAGR